jgi:hypothetical protein
MVQIIRSATRGICRVQQLIHHFGHIYHKIGTQLPYETWLMRNNNRAPTYNEFSVRLVYCTGDAFHFGIENHLIEGINVKIYSTAKTIAEYKKSCNRFWKW